MPLHYERRAGRKKWSFATRPPSIEKCLYTRKSCNDLVRPYDTLPVADSGHTDIAVCLDMTGKHWYAYSGLARLSECNVTAFVKSLCQ